MSDHEYQAAPTAAPDDLSPVGQLRYMAIVRHLDTRWSEVWEPIVKRYVLCMDAADAAMAGLPRMPDGSPRLTTRGSQDQHVQHPLWRAWLDASRAAASAATELGITPRQMADVLGGPPAGDDPLAP